MRPGQHADLPRFVVATLTPRGLGREEAAAYCGLTPSGFDDWVTKGRMPPPVHGTKRWDRIALDLAWDRLSGLQNKDSAQDGSVQDWLKANGYAG